MPNSDPLHPSDTSKAPGFRPPLQRPLQVPQVRLYFLTFLHLLIYADDAKLWLFSSAFTLTGPDGQTVF